MASPERYEARDVLRDGRPVRIRAIRPTDKAALVRGFSRLSEESIYRRFFTVKKSLTEGELEYLTEIDFVDHVALLVLEEREEQEEALGVGRFIRTRPEPTAAEVAFTVDQNHRGLGVGSLLLEHLTRIALSIGVTTFVADVLADNQNMLDVFRRSTLAMTSTIHRGVTRVELVLDAGGDS